MIIGICVIEFTGINVESARESGNVLTRELGWATSLDLFLQDFVVLDVGHLNALDELEPSNKEAIIIFELLTHHVMQFWFKQIKQEITSGHIVVHIVMIKLGLGGLLVFPGGLE